MAHITKAELNQIYKSRKVLNQAINDVLGADLNLYDISESSQKSSISNNSVNKINNDPFTSNNNKITNNGVNVKSANNRKSQKYDDFFMNVSNQSRVQRLYKENIELQKKIMTIKDENQNYKNKALLWQKTKQYIIDNIHKEFKLKSIRFNSSDGAIFQQFIIILSELINKNHVNNTIYNKQKDQNNYKQLLHETKCKLQEQTKKISKLNIQIDLLMNQNQILKQRQNTFQRQRKARMSQIQQNIYEKFANIQKSLHQKTQQNELLKSKIVKLQSDLNQNKNNLRKDKTISTMPETIKDFSQIQLNRKMSKIKDDEINILKQQTKLLSGQVQSLKTVNQKMKKVIKLAQSLNNQFLDKLQQSFRKNQDFNPNVLQQYHNKGLMQKRDNTTSPEFHLTNKRFKIVKSRSVQKQKFVYGQKNKNE